MLWDILIAAGIGFTQLVLTWYGVHVSVTENRIRNAFIIGIVGAAGIGLTIYGAIRSGTAQQALQTQLDRIQRNTERPQPAPVVNVNPPIVNFPAQEAFVTLIERNLFKFQIGQHIEVNFTSANLSQQVAARDEYGYSLVYVVDTSRIGFDKDAMVSPSIEDKQYSAFLTETSKIPINATRTYGPNQNDFSSAYGPILDAETLKAITNETKAIFHATSYLWRDGGGEHVNEVCEWMQPNSFEPNRAQIWHYCNHHNGEHIKK